ncbi:hypothetical protein HK099_005075 [Clydaea vesicula]|uniref:Methylthioribulose-1-phosphate dehydratase n=1 Tax=Clydaea vesicula TaxID=447962 RepID=A0AAD5U2X1_9FUNG|nr:hypothetical protein HK099_005075 [Clydaea vesicula]KAJ3394620.1 hypothetical protein HDU92_006725 [Lobulomyces angularis]
MQQTLKKRKHEENDVQNNATEGNDSNLSVLSSDPEHASNLIPELCKLFYNNGWVTGTGGGMTIRQHDHYYIAPSGVQKERMQPSDLFILNKNQEIISLPHNKSLKMSQCTPLFFNAYNLRNCGACIHTHSQNAVLATLLFSGSHFTITHQEMIKGIRRGDSKDYYKYYDTLTVPIIENTAEERDLKERMEKAILDNPDTNAVLVRRHGVYVWGETWEKAKCMTECYDYLFEIAVKMKKLNLDPTEVPKDSEYK